MHRHGWLAVVIHLSQDRAQWKAASRASLRDSATLSSHNLNCWIFSKHCAQSVKTPQDPVCGDSSHLASDARMNQMAHIKGLTLVAGCRGPSGERFLIDWTFGYRRWHLGESSVSNDIRECCSFLVGSDSAFTTMTPAPRTNMSRAHR